MKTFTIATLLALATFVVALKPDQAGAENVGNGQGQQFIGGGCKRDADCGSGCCAGPIGICSGLEVSFQSGKTGCGFNSTSGGQSAAPTAAPPASAKPVAAAAGTANEGGPPFDPAGAKNVGNGRGDQFIGGQCQREADCKSKCCAGPRGICSGLGAQLLAGKDGCGFVAKGFVSIRRSSLEELASIETASEE